MVAMKMFTTHDIKRHHKQTNETRFHHFDDDTYQSMLMMKKMLLSTIENGETKYLKPRGYQIGGKTGTAQIPIEGHYDATKTIATFIGFSPIKNPQFIGLVIVKEPKTSQWGSETAAPIFFDIAKELIVYYNIAPE